jgi:hypothetical protein
VEYEKVYINRREIPWRSVSVISVSVPIYCTTVQSWEKSHFERYSLHWIFNFWKKLSPLGERFQWVFLTRAFFSFFGRGRFSSFYVMFRSGLSTTNPVFCRCFFNQKVVLIKKLLYFFVLLCWVLCLCFVLFISPFMSLTGYNLGMNIFHFEAFPVSSWKSRLVGKALAHRWFLTYVWP